MRGAILNPIRFFDSVNLPDSINTFPNLDNVPYDDSYIFGIASSPDKIRNHIGIAYFQFLNEDNEVKTFYVYKLSENNTFELDSSVDTVDISPVGWVGYQMHKLTLDLADGFYYVISEDGLKSDVFRITSNTSITEDLVKIKYSYSYNKFGCIFGTNFFEAYFRGQLMPGEPRNEIDAFDGDTGVVIKTQSTPYRTATLNILSVSHLYKDLIDKIFACNTIEVNGIAYENSEGISWSHKEGSDIGDATVKLFNKINDYYYE